MRVKESLFNDFQRGFDSGWAACERFYEQQALDRDPAFQHWLDKMERLGRLNRARDELLLEQQQMAAQAADDEAN